MLKRVKILFLSAIFVVATTTIVFAESVRYINIDHIAIKLNIDFDLDDLENDSIPDISCGEDSQSNVWTSNSKYEIESADWYDPDPSEFKIGAEPRILVYLSTKEYEGGGSDYYERVYRFNSSYSASTLTVTNGKFISAHKDSESSLRVVVAAKPIKGTYNTPENVYWDGDTGIGSWVPAETRDSGFYSLVLKRGSTTVATIPSVHEYSYNFAPYINKAGDYSFTVRTISKDGTDKYGNKISVLGYGCMRFTGKGMKLDYNKTEKELLAAYNAGVNYFDTAYIYPGSEELLGEVLEKNNIRDKVNIVDRKSVV